MNYIFLLAGLFLLACGEKKQAPTASTSGDKRVDTTAKAPYFPVMDFMRSEIAYVDSLPVGIMKYRQSGKAQDSAYIQPQDFHRLASRFVADEICDSSFERNFDETSFFDNNTNSATFLYTSKNRDQKLTRVDVVSAKKEVYDEVKSIYMEKHYQSGDTSVIERLYWKPQRNFQIITQKSHGSNEPVTELIKVVWDNRE